MTIERPREVTNLRPPFERVGEPGWADRLRDLLDAYGVPTATPVSAGELREVEARLGVSLDGPLRQLLLTLGPVDFRTNRVLRPKEIRFVSHVWYAGSMPDADRTRLGHLVGVMEYLGDPDEFVAWDQRTTSYVRVGHDPARGRPWLPTFDDCLREQCIALAVGHYGWPEQDVGTLVQRAKAAFLPAGDWLGRD